MEKKGLTSHDFAFHRDVYLFIQQHLEQYGSVPTHAQVTFKHPDLQPLAGDFNWWLDGLSRRVYNGKLLQAMQIAFDKSAADPYAAADDLIGSLSLLRASIETNVQAVDATTADRFERYLLRRDFLRDGSTLGIRTGLDIIDQTRQGWMNGELVGIYARPTTGKTWFLCWQAAMAWAQGLKVLIYSPEMPARQLAMRCDVMVAHQLGLPLSYRMLVNGGESIEQNYNALTSQFSGERFWIYDSVDGRSASVSDIGILARQHKPDIIMIDGLSLLRQEGRSSAIWEQIKDTSYGLKNLATVQDTVIMVTHQAVREVKKDNDGIGLPSLTDAAYGDAFGQACTTVLTMANDRYHSHIRWYGIRKSRERSWEEDPPHRMALFWQVDAGCIEDLSRLGHVAATVETAVNERLNRGRQVPRAS